MNELLEAALVYVSRGWPVFPLHGIVNGACTCGHANCSSPGKHPLVRRGLFESTTDRAKIRGWWRRWRCANIGIATGIATGAESGIAVIDIDLPTAFGSLSSLLGSGVGVTLTALTGGGGLHLVYACTDEELGNSAGRLPGLDSDLPGIDLRANGGYIVGPPSAHHSGGTYQWLDPERDLAPIPAWVKQPARYYVELEVVKPADFDGDGTHYGLAILRHEQETLRGAKTGTRNHQLNRSAFAIAQLVAGGELREAAARDSLLKTASEIGLDEPEARQTIDSAFDAGLRRPRVAPHRIS